MEEWGMRQGRKEANMGYMTEPVTTVGRGSSGNSGNRVAHLREREPLRAASRA